MAEEEKESTGTSIKNIIIGLISTVTLGVGGFITTKLTGGEEKEATPAAAPVINIQNTQTQQQAAGGGKTVIIKEKEAAKPADQPKPKKKEGDEFKEAEPKW
jgi:hypothetical protein